MSDSATRPGAPSAGAVFAERYTLLHALGVESVGHVWAARDQRTGRLVQIKLLAPEFAADPVKFKRFGREITASFLVTHPNTVEVIDYGDKGGAPYLVLEYLVAHTLADELARAPGHRLDPRRAAAIAVQLVHAIGAAHQEGIVHRALSPVNVLLLDNVAPRDRGEDEPADEGRLPAADYVKVRDFGLAKLDSGEDTEGDAEVTATEIRVGDAAYMSPEYIASGVFHPKGDLYAAGALLFQMIAGRTPFFGEGEAQIPQHASASPPRLVSLVPAVPEWLDELVAELLEKDPEARPGIHAIVARIEEGLDGAIGLPSLLPLDADGNVIRPRPPPSDPPSALPLRVLTVGALGVVAAAGVVAVLAALAVVLAALTAR